MPNDALNILAGQPPSLPFAGTHGPGFTTQEYSDALGPVAQGAFNIAMPLGLGELGAMPRALSILSGLVGPFDNPDPRVMPATIPTKKNIWGFVTAMQRALGGRPWTPANTAEAYMQIRYPNRMSLPSSIEQWRYQDMVNSGGYKTGFTDGFLDESTGKLIHIDPDTIPKIHLKSILQEHPEGTAGYSVDTLGHETQHAVQLRLAGRNQSYQDKLFKELDEVPYEQREAEVKPTGFQTKGGYPAGEIARNGYLKFLKLLQDARDALFDK